MPNLLNCFDRGAISYELLFVEFFNKFPNRYSFFKEDLKIKTSSLSKRECIKLFGNDCIITIKSSKNIYSTSKADEDESWDETLGHWNKPGDQPEILILNTKEEWILRIQSTSIVIWFTNIDAEIFVDNLVSKLPILETISKTATIDLVAYDNSYYTINSKIKKTLIDLDLNYNDDLKEMREDLLKFITERESGIAILHGVAGSGKTHFIKNLISTLDKKFILVTNAIAAHMAEPEFIAFMMENKDSIFILEDCEQILMAREENRFGGAIANILNMSDGLMSDIFNIKFICTFNTDISNIDDALLRPGRCYVNYEFKPLCKEKVKILSDKNNLGITEIRDMTLAEIYNYVPSKEEPIKQKRIGF